MIVKNYELSEEYSPSMRIGDSADVLNPSDKIQTPPSLIVWQNALAERCIEAGMNQADWPLLILEHMPQSAGWKWEMQTSLDEKSVTDWAQIVKCCKAATGLEESPRGNVSITLPLRTYQEKDSEVGGIQWWLEQKSNITLTSTFIESLINKMIEMLSEAKRVGADFYVEQISMIIAKDPNDKIATLTPTLHSDTFYGFRETAICSLTEKGCNRYSGTLFAPTIKMSSIEQHRPIDLSKMIEILADVPIVEARSGDLLLYDGMIGEDGEARMCNGAPHISPDLPGQSARLVILMRNKGNQTRRYESSSQQVDLA